MADLTFDDSHSMVAYLEKSEDNADFAEIVDFLNASPIRYALTVSPTIYVSYIEQFWSTAKTKTVNNETQIHARVDGKTIAITESSMRRDLHFDDKDDITLVLNDEYHTPSHTKKVFANIRRQGKDFSGTVTPFFATMLIQLQAVEGEGSGQPTEPQYTPTTASPSHVEPIPTIPSSSQPKKTQKYRKTKRKVTEISQSSGHTTLVADETVHEERGDSVERAATTATSLDPECQDTILGDRPAQTRFERLSKQSNDPPLSRVNTLGSGEDSMKLTEMMELCTKLSERVLALENIKTARDLEITNLKKRVKKLEKKKQSRTLQLKRRLFKVKIESYAEKSLGDQEDASKQGRNEIDQDEGISWFQEDAETQGRYGHDISTAEVTTISVPSDVDVSAASPTRPVDDSTTDDITLAETLMKIKSTKDKGKGIMQAPEKLVKVKGKDQIKYDADVAQRLQAELDEEARLEREREEEASNAALIEEWDSIEATINADRQLAKQLQAQEREELIVEEQQKIDDDDKEREDLKQCFEIVRDEEFVVHDIPLAVKPAPIVGFQIHRAGRQGSYEIIRANGKDDIRRNLQGQKILLWKLYDSCGIHFVRFENMHIYMLVEKRYPLSPTTITDMLNRKLQADYWNETCEAHRFKNKNEALHVSSKSSSSGSFDTEINPKVKIGLGYGKEETVCNVSESDVSEIVFDTSTSDKENSQTYDRFKKVEGFHAVPPLLLGNFIPPKADLSFVGLDDSVYTSTAVT
ncbi:hypothetical protein Tco_1132895 [Tanacetum coccineum]|uniref:Xylulose kinase-1 n=1 Tax=Tanacetum coccineum TaxID=301880 RepID=A0ABQ5JHA1_9ASTR